MPLHPIASTVALVVSLGVAHAAAASVHIDAAGLDLTISYADFDSGTDGNARTTLNTPIVAGQSWAWFGPDAAADVGQGGLVAHVAPDGQLATLDFTLERSQSPNVELTMSAHGWIDFVTSDDLATGGLAWSLLADPSGSGTMNVSLGNDVFIEPVHL